MLRIMFWALLLGFALLHVPVARAAGLCAAQPNNDTLRPLPAALVPQVQQAFGLHMSAAQTQRMTVTRCMGGKLYACVAGANLPCGKANLGTSLPAAKEWCTQKPDADYIPAYISGHDTAYNWRCQGGKAEIVPPSAALDARGFFQQYWKPVG